MGRSALCPLPTTTWKVHHCSAAGETSTALDHLNLASNKLDGRLSPFRSRLAAAVGAALHQQPGAGGRTLHRDVHANAHRGVKVAFSPGGTDICAPNEQDCSGSWLRGIRLTAGEGCANVEASAAAYLVQSTQAMKADSDRVAPGRRQGRLFCGSSPPPSHSAHEGLPPVQGAPSTWTGRS